MHAVLQCGTLMSPAKVRLREGPVTDHNIRPSPQFRLRVPLPRVAVNNGTESAQALVVKTIDKAARAIEGISVTRTNPLPIPGPLCFSIWLPLSFSRRVIGNSVAK